jgi:hypothetical protein
METKTPCILIDAYGDFLSWWKGIREADWETQIEGWHDDYMAAYPELRQMQVDDYAQDGYDWREIATKHVWPQLAEGLPAMKEAHDNLLLVVPEICQRAVQVLEMDFRPRVVLYVGIGLGAGWATRYRGDPACLLGLEMIAQLHWQKQERLRGLVAHEFGHLLHMAWRDEWEAFAQAEEEDPLFLLYSEGFAQRCEQHIMGQVSWHQDKAGWLAWCESNLEWLAGEYLHRLETGESVRDFFGSWFEVRGRRQTGYYLGHAWIEAMESTASLRQIARWSREQVRQRGRGWLQQTGASSSGQEETAVPRQAPPP